MQANAGDNQVKAYPGDMGRRLELAVYLLWQFRRQVKQRSFWRKIFGTLGRRARMAPSSDSSGHFGRREFIVAAPCPVADFGKVLVVDIPHRRRARPGTGGRDLTAGWSA